MKHLVLVLALFAGFTSFSQTERKVYLLDMTPINNETSLSRYNAVVDILNFIKVPYDTGSSLTDMANYPVVITASRIANNALSPSEVTAVENYVQNGGVIISSYLKEFDLYNLFGISNSTSANNLFLMNFDTTQQPNLFHYINDTLETQIALGGTNETSNYITKKYTPLPNAQILGRYENNFPAFIKNDFGSGSTYLFGPDFRDLTQRNLVNKDVNSHRTYSNGFEPSTDVIMFIIRNIIREHIPYTIYPHTIPNANKSVVLITHDVDSRTGIDTMGYFSTYEMQNGIKGQYNVTCRYFSDDWMSGIYIGSFPMINQIKNDGHVLSSHSIGHFPDFADFPFGSLGNNSSNYNPLYTTPNTANGSILGELEVSRDLLENDFNVDVKSFRAGHLTYPDSLIIGLDTLDYLYNSTYSANNILTGFPYYAYRTQKFSGDKSPVLEIPMTISDVFHSDPISNSNYPQKVQQWLDASYRYEANHSPITLLIHPNRQYKLTAQQDYINGLNNTTVTYGFEDFGAFWKNRTALDYNTELTNDSLLVTINNNLMVEQSFLLDADGLDTVLFFDQNNQSITFNSIQWNSRQRLYYQGTVISVEENDLVKTNLSVYPNPAKDYINFTASDNFSTILIYSISGKQIESISVNNQKSYQLKITDLANGLYFYKVQVEDNILSGKFVVQH